MGAALIWNHLNSHLIQIKKIYCLYQMLQNSGLTDHVVKRRVIATGEEVGEEVDHHQPIFLSLKEICFIYSLENSNE